MTTLTVDFTNTELWLKSCDETVSTLGSIDSFDDDSDTESTTSSSSSGDEEILIDMRILNDKYGTNLTSSSPDLFAKGRRNRSEHKSPRANARWSVAVATRSLNDLKVDLSPKSKLMRKTKSLDDKEEKEDACSNDRWTASPSQQRPKLSRDILQDGGGRWSSSSSSNQLKRTSTNDSTPRIPRASAPDLKTIRRCASSEDNRRTNARWNANSLSPKPSRTNPLMPSRAGRLSPRIKRDSAPAILRRREDHLLGDDSNDDDHDEEAELDSRWMSSTATTSRRSASGILDGLVASNATPAEARKKSLPIRGALSRWNSSSSFKTINSVTSIDQWSTKPKLPKRRRRSDQSKTKKAKSGQTKEDHPMKPQVHPADMEPQCLVSERATTASEAPEEPVEEEGPLNSTCIPSIIGLDEDPESADQEQREEEEEEEEAVEEDDEEEENIDSFEASFRPSCMECFETILEEANEDELGISSTPMRLRCDSVLLAPKRRKSEHSLVALDDSGLDVSLSMSMSMSMSMSISNASMQGSSCRRRGSEDFSSRHGSGCCRRGSGENSRHECLGPRQPRRRDSIQENATAVSTGMRCESGCSVSSTGSEGCDLQCNHRRLAPPSPRTMTTATTMTNGALVVRRAWKSRRTNDEKHCHPLLDEKHPLASTAKGRTVEIFNNCNCPAA